MKKLLPFLAVLLYSFSASAQFVTVNAQLVDGSGATSLTSFLRFSLYNCGSNLPVYSAGNLVMVKKQFDLKPDASGLVTGSVVPNDKILCGGVASTLWTITPMKDALTPIQPAQQYDILSSNGTFNLASAMPTNPALAPPGFVVIFGNPTISQTISQPVGTSMTFLGTFDFTKATVLGLATSGGGGTGPFSTGTTPCIPYYTGSANSCDVALQTDGSGNELAASVTASSALTTPLLNTTGTGWVKVFKTQSTPCTAQSGFMCMYGDSITQKWICLNSDGSSCAPTGGGGSLTTSLNGVNLSSQSVLNFTNPASFNGLTFTYSNPSAGNLTFIVGGLLDLATQTHNSTTVNGQTCTLGSSCSITAGGASAIEAWAGDGSDGAVTADGSTTLPCLGAPAASTYTMTRDCYFTTLTVNSGVIIKTVSNRILASVSVTNSGTIQNIGTVGPAGGAATGTNKSTGGTAAGNSASLAPGSLSAPLSSSAGKTGASGGTGVGASGTQGNAGTSNGTNLTQPGIAGVAGGNGGASGASGGNNAGGTGGLAGTANSSPLDNATPHEVRNAVTLRDPAGTSFQAVASSAGSGSGAAGGGDGVNAGGGGGGSGAQGAQGGFIVIIAPTITLNVASVINVSGGNGGNGGAGGTPTTGNCGGGGGGAGGNGGNGGIIVRIYNTLTNNGTDTRAAGSGGTGGALGTGVGTGTNGTVGANGTVGVTGLVYNLQLN